MLERQEKGDSDMFCELRYVGDCLAFYKHTTQEICFSQEIHYSNCSEFKSDHVQFEKNNCGKQFDVTDFIQVRKIMDKTYIYCFGNEIRIGDQTIPCPNFVFELYGTDQFRFDSLIAHNVTQLRFNSEDFDSSRESPKLSAEPKSLSVFFVVEWFSN